MSGYEHPTDKGTSKTTVTFWAELWRPMEKNSHGESLVSPRFGTEPECVAWVRQRRREFDQVGMWKRVSREGHDYEDIPLNTEDAPLPDKARLHALVAELKTLIEQKKRDLDRGGPGVKVKRPARTMDPLEIRQFSYHEVYDEDDKPRFEFDADGWPL